MTWSGADTYVRAGLRVNNDLSLSAACIVDGSVGPLVGTGSQ